MDELNVNPIKNIEAAIEAILYAAGYPVRYDKMKRRMARLLQECSSGQQNMMRLLRAV